MKYKSAQEVFDTVRKHLEEQGKPAVVQSPFGGGPVCLYRTKDGLKCSIGCLIPDEDYVIDMEHRNLTCLTSRYDQLEWMANYKDLLVALQNTHDDWSRLRNPDCTWEEHIAKKLPAIAARFGLAY